MENGDKEDDDKEDDDVDEIEAGLELRLGISLGKKFGSKLRPPPRPGKFGNTKGPAEVSCSCRRTNSRWQSWRRTVPGSTPGPPPRRGLFSISGKRDASGGSNSSNDFWRQKNTKRRTEIKSDLNLLQVSPELGAVFFRFVFKGYRALVAQQPMPIPMPTPMPTPTTTNTRTRFSEI